MNGAGISNGERVYFGAVAILAGWVGFWGYFVPTRVDKAIPFSVPPLHARFLGAVYLSGATIMVGSILARRWDRIVPVPTMTAVWTGGLALISLFHLEFFAASEPQTWIWFGAYIVYPLVGIWLAIRHRGEPGPEDATLPRGARAYLIGQGAIFILAGVALALAPGTMSRVWPWSVTPMLAQIYSAPLLAYGIGSSMLARSRTWPELRVVTIGMFVFAAGALLASAIHRDLFSFGDAADLLWFTLLGVATATLGAIATRSLIARPDIPTER